MNLQEIKKQLPAGAVKEIARRANVNPSTVSNAFNNKLNSPKLSTILQVTADYLTEYRTKEMEAMDALQKALQA